MKTAKDIYTYAFAALFVVGFFVLAYILRNVADNSFIIGVIETLKMGVVLILGYFFGSSAGSAAKNDIIAKATEVKPETPEVK
jgi:hypothetical protein